MTKISTLKITSIFINSVIALFFFFLYYVCDKDISQVAFIGILQYAWMITSWYFATKKWMNVYLFFLILSFCFYLGQPVLYLFNVDLSAGMTITTSPFTPNQITSTLIFILKAMAVFHLGASFSVDRLRNKSTESTTNKKKAIGAVGMFLFLISVVPQLSATFESLKATLTVGYYTIFQSDYAVGSGINGGIPRLLAGFFKPSLLLLILANKDNPVKLKFWIWFSVIFSVAMIISGQRGSNSLFIVGLILLYHYAIKPFTKRQFIKFGALIVIGILAFSSISTIRNMGLSNYSFTDLIDILSGKHFLFDLLTEMGFTLIASTTVMVFSPSMIPFNDGATYFNSLYSLVPNLFWEVNPAAVGGVDQVFKSMLVEGSGIGSSLIIEAYYNFGMYALLVMPLFGYFMGKLHVSMAQASNDKNYLKLFMCIYLTTVVLWFVRSETITFWREYGYYTLLPLLLIASLTALNRTMSNSKVVLARLQKR